MPSERHNININATRNNRNTMQKFIQNRKILFLLMLSVVKNIGNINTCYTAIKTKQKNFFFTNHIKGIAGIWSHFQPRLWYNNNMKSFVNVIRFIIWFVYITLVASSLLLDITLWALLYTRCYVYIAPCFFLMFVFFLIFFLWECNRLCALKYTSMHTCSKLTTSQQF